MKVTREKTWVAFNSGWCPNCAAYTKMEHIYTGLPGIASQNCLSCGTNYQANFLENGADELEVPDNFVFL